MKPKDLIIELFKLTESSEPLNTNDLIPTVISYAGWNDKGEYAAENYKERLKAFRIGLGRLFKNLDKMLDGATDVADENVGILRKHREKLNTVPIHGLANDTDKVLAFIKGLPEKDLFNISNAAELIGITRQTLKKKIDEGYLDIKFVYLSKAPLIKKGDVVMMYRELNTTEEGYYGF